MALDKQINIAVILSAYDKMSSVINATVVNATRRLNEVAEASKRYGESSIKSGLIAAAPLIAASKAFADQEDAMLQMKAELLQAGNTINQKVFNDLVKYASESSNKYGESAADYMKMIRVLRENSIDPKEILGGIGDAVEKLSVLFHVAPDSIAQFSARMRQDMGILPKEMTGMMDLIARLKNAGVGKDGAEAVTEMSEAFSKAGLGAHNLGVTGLQAGKDLGALMGIFIRRGISGSSVGTNFRRIFDGLRDANKIKKANDAAKEFGITLDFYDKHGKFKGIASFAGEMSKLKGLDPTQIASILKPFGGKQGLSTDFLEFLGKDGLTSFNEFQQKLSSQATLDAKVDLMMSGLTRQYQRVKSEVINTAAAIGSTYAPELKSLITDISANVRMFTHFIVTHKELVGNIAKGLAYFAAFKLAVGGTAWTFGYLLKSVSSVISTTASVYNFIKNFSYGFVKLIPIIYQAVVATWSFTAALLANPITWIVIAMIALAAVVYLVIKNWDKISSFFRALWSRIAGYFTQGWNWIKSITSKFYNAGKNIISSLWEGMKSMAMKPVETIVSIVTNVRKYLPFSPAKEGPLRDIHRIKLIETIASSIKAKPMLDAMGVAMKQVYNFSPGRSQSQLSFAGNNAPVNFNLTVNLSGSATHQDANNISSILEQKFSELMRRHKQSEIRTAY